MTPTLVNKPSARKSLCLLTNILDVKKKTAIRRVGAAKLNCKAIQSGTTPWALKPKQKVNSRINDQIKKSLYNWIMYHPQFVQSPIFNDCLKANIDGHTRSQFFPKLLLQVSVRELHNILVSDPVDGGLNEPRDTENNTIISDSTLCSLFTPQLIVFIKIQSYVWL